MKFCGGVSLLPEPNRNCSAALEEDAAEVVLGFAVLRIEEAGVCGMDAGDVKRWRRRWADRNK